MRAKRERAAEAFLLCAMAVAVIGVVYGSAIAAPEPGTCINNYCKNILVYYPCGGMSAIVLDRNDCYNCVNGRCDGGAVVTCGNQGNTLHFDFITPNPVCDCNNAPAPPFKVVEATGTSTLFPNELTPKRKLCQGGGGG